MKPNVLVNIDALEMLERIENECADLVYLDPPGFQKYNKKQKENTEEEYNEFIYKVLQQSKRILKRTGNLVFFSEPFANINFQPLIVKVFGAGNFVGEFIVPQGNVFHQRFPQRHSTMIFYGRTNENYFNNQIEMSSAEVEKLFPYIEKRGRYRLTPLISKFDRPSMTFEWQGIKLPIEFSWRYSKMRLDELFAQGYIDTSRGRQPMLKTFAGEDNLKKNIGTIWSDIATITKPYNGYHGSQSEELLQRVITMGTPENSVIIDPFCGSGTSLVVSSKLNRKWIGCDNSIEAVNITKQRLEASKLYDFKQVEEIDIRQLRKIWNYYERLHSTIEDVVIQMIANGETDNVEFKESAAYNYRTQKVEKEELTENILQAIASFLNSEGGGTLLIGVKNDKSIIDLANGDYEAANKQKKDQDGYALYINDKVQKLLGVNAVSKCKITFCQINFCEICILQIKASSQVVFLKGDFFIRNGNRKIKMNNEDFFDYVKSRFDIINKNEVTLKSNKSK